MKPTNRSTGIQLLIAILLTVSCAEDEIGRTPIPPQDPRVSFSLQAPRAGTKAGTKAAPGTGLTDEEERAINNLTILVFSETATSDLLCEKVFENLQPTAVSGTENAQYTVAVPLPKGRYYLLFLANVADKIAAAPPVGKILSAIESTLLHEMQDKWDIYAHPGFPMSGATTGFITITDSYVHPQPILMLRTLARINLSVAADVKDYIKINAIHLHNPSSRGLVIPAAANLDTTAANGYIRATAPTLPLNTAGTPDPGLLATPWEYTSAEILNGDSCYNTIYAMEGFDPEGLGENEYAWLEITATYKDKEEKPYRVDLWQEESDGTRTLIPILRNHTYDITITGMNEIEEDLEVEVHLWDDGDMSHIIMEGQYYLKVNQATFNLDREKRDSDSFNNDLEITTNHEDGWVITRITDPGNNDAEINMDNGWIRIDPDDRKGDGGEENSKTIKLLLDKNETSSSRSAHIHLQVGRLLDFIVKVNQSTETVLELSVEYLDGNPVSELFFYEYYGWDDEHTPQDIRVRWSPYGENYQCDIQVNFSGDSPFEFGTQSHTLATGTLDNTDGSQHYTLYPQPFTESEVSQKGGNPFLHRGMRVTFTVTDENNSNYSLSKTIYLRHQHMAIISDDLRQAVDMGVERSFNILSNTSWKISTIEDDGILNTSPQDGLTGGNDIVTGTEIKYTTEAYTDQDSPLPGRGLAGRKATIYVEDLQGYIPNPVPFKLTAVYNDANSYILNPAGTLAERTVEIPIRKLFWAWDIYAGQDLGTITSQQLETEVIWTSVYLNNNLNANPQPYDITTRMVHDSNVLESMLHVEIPLNPDVSGNAIVGVRRQGQTGWLYSWPIWITNYDPEQAGNQQQTRADSFMDRNLGALEDNALETGASVHGMFYQWGRKDPLRLSDISPTSPAVAATNNLGNALNNPHVFYRGISSNFDWFTNQSNRSNQNDYLWNDWDNSKGIFDPCPEGWRLPGQTWEDVHTPWDNITASLGTLNNSNGRAISIILFDNSISGSTFARYHFSGSINSGGNLRYHTESTNPANEREECNLWNCTPTTDSPHYGSGLSRTTYSYNNARNRSRASALPVRCIKEKNQ